MKSVLKSSLLAPRTQVHTVPHMFYVLPVEMKLKNVEYPKKCEAKAWTALPSQASVVIGPLSGLLTVSIVKNDLLCQHILNGPFVLSKRSHKYWKEHQKQSENICCDLDLTPASALLFYIKYKLCDFL